MRSKLHVTVAMLLGSALLLGCSESPSSPRTELDVRSAVSTASAGSGGNVKPTLLSGRERVEGMTLTLTTTGTVSAGAGCPEGKKILGGGYRMLNRYGLPTTGNWRVTESIPSETGEVWIVTVELPEPAVEIVTLTPFAICATA